MVAAKTAAKKVSIIVARSENAVAWRMARKQLQRGMYAATKQQRSIMYKQPHNSA